MADCPYCTRAMSSLEFCTPIPGQQVAHAACRLSYLAGVRAGLRAAGEVCEEDAAGLERIAGNMERQGLGSQRTHALTAARACRDAAARIAALDAEEVAGREP